MTDQYSLCHAAFITQVRTLSDPYFPEAAGLAAGWQVSENDMLPIQGGDYFVILRPGIFTGPKRGQNNDNEWHITANLYMRFSEYESLWPAFRAFRADVLGLTETAPLKGNHIIGQEMAAVGNPQFLVDNITDQYLNIVVQTLDITIRQRVLVTRNL